MTTKSASETAEQPRKRVWVQDVAVTARVLQTRLEVAANGDRGLDQQATADGIRALLEKARDAAYRDNPIPGRWANWWRGTLVEAAHQNLHAAKAEIVTLYDAAELAAEIPGAVARAQAVMHQDDPRFVDEAELAAMSLAERRTRLRRLIEDGYSAHDDQHQRLRSFRNIVLMTAGLVALLVTVTVIAVSLHPNVMPLCFTDPTAGTSKVVNCPTRSRVAGPSGGDVLVVALLGLLGGALAAALSIRNLKGTSTPYDVPVGLAMLKGPLGAFTGILGLVAIHGDFVPGLSELDSQEQILAYALLFGFGQQVFTRLLDQRAQTLLDGLPAKDTSIPPSPRATARRKPSTPVGGQTDPAAGPADTNGTETDLTAQPSDLAADAETGSPADLHA